MNSNRGFLNKKQGLAAFDWEVGDIEPWLNAGNVNVCLDAGFSISDCRRSITLDFDIYNEEDYNLALEKVDILIYEFINFKEALFKEYHKERKVKDEESVQKE